MININDRVFTDLVWRMRNACNPGSQTLPGNIYLYLLVTVVEGVRKAPFSIATTQMCRGVCYSFPWIALLYPSYVPYIAEVWSKEVSSTIFKVFIMTQPGIEPRSSGPLTNTLFYFNFNKNVKYLFIWVYMYIYIYSQNTLLNMLNIYIYIYIYIYNRCRDSLAFLIS